MQVDSSLFTSMMSGSSSVSGMQKSQGSMPPPPPPPGGSEEGGSDPLSSFVSSIEEEEGSIIENALSNLSSEGQDALKQALEAYREEGISATSEEREKQFLTILNDIFTNYDQDTSATGILLSQYA